MKKLSEMMIDNVFVTEGIDIDYDNNIVSYNPTHENDVDTSLVNNPTFNNDFGEDVKIYSIFKRKSNTEEDGNPLFYAIKNENNWKFRTNRDKNAIFSQIEKITDKFAKMYELGVTVLIPSGGNVNCMLADLLKSKSRKTMVIDDAILKISTGDLWYIITNDVDCPFRQYYRKKNKTEDAYKKLRLYTNKMDKEREGDFTRHYVLDSKMRDLLDTTFKLSKEAIVKYAKDINDKDILIVDDSISRGQSVKEAINIIKSSYSPKSITVLTLFSKKYD